MILLLAQSTAPTWPDRLLGPDTPSSALAFFMLICLALLAVVVVVLAGIIGMFKESWDLFRFLRTTRDIRFPCTNCGYDLRHKPDQCPECGQRVWFRDRKGAAPIKPPPTSPPEAPDLEGQSQRQAPPDITNNPSLNQNANEAP